MPTEKSNRRGGKEKSRMSRLSEKASSFHGRGGAVGMEALPRPRTVPDLLIGRRSSGSSAEDVVSLATPPKLTKLLLNVTVQRSLGAVRVVISMEATVEDLITAALRQYSKEVRAHVLPCYDASAFDLHYSQFSLESLDRRAKLIDLGSRNFFLCPKKATAGEEESAASPSASGCAKEADKLGTTKVLPWLKFMNFLL